MVIGGWYLEICDLVNFRGNMDLFRKLKNYKVRVFFLVGKLEFKMFGMGLCWGRVFKGLGFFLWVVDFIYVFWLGRKNVWDLKLRCILFFILRVFLDLKELLNIEVRLINFW